MSLFSLTIATAMLLKNASFCKKITHFHIYNPTLNNFAAKINNMNAIKKENFDVR